MKLLFTLFLFLHFALHVMAQDKPIPLLTEQVPAVVIKTFNTKFPRHKKQTGAVHQTKFTR